MKRLLYTIKLAWQMYTIKDFAELSKQANLLVLYDMIIRVAFEGKPLLSKMGVFDLNGDETTLVTLWAGVGRGADPMRRIDELLEEIRRLNVLIDKQSKVVEL